MKAFFLSLIILCCLMQKQSLAQPGAVLWEFSIELSTYRDAINCVRVQPDSKIVAAGNSNHGSYMTIAVGRFDAAGIPDPSFGISGDGMVINSLDSANTFANAVALQEDGKIVVAGGYQKDAIADFILARYNPDGSPDSSFGINGIVRTDIGFGTYDEATTLAIQPDGKIVAAGRLNSTLALCRYKTDGSLDSSFATNGKFTGTAPGATCMKLQANGKIVAGCDSVVMRLHPDGSPDTGFGTEGITPLFGHCYDLALQNDGKMRLAGSGHPPGEHLKFDLERLDTTGSHDLGFGVEGVVTTGDFIPPFSASNIQQSATAVCLQPDGRILASGWTRHGLLMDHGEIAIARYNANGALDSSFGINGKVITLIPGSYADIGNSAVINHNNELVVAGINNGFSGQGGWVLVGYDLGPMLGVYTAPGTGGQIMVAPNPAGDFARIQSKNLENGTWHLSVCDFTGRILSREKVFVTNNTLDKSISLAGLPAGAYLVKLDNGIRRMTVKLAKSR